MYEVIIKVKDMHGEVYYRTLRADTKAGLARLKKRVKEETKQYKDR